MKKLLLLPFLFMAFSLLAQTKLTIQSPSEKCGTVQSSFPNSGGDDGLGAERENNHDGTFNVVRSFLQFDLSSIPSGSFINWARLSLFNSGSVQLDQGNNSALLRRVTSSWDPATVSWNTQPATAKRGTVRLPMSTEPHEDYKNINVTNLVQVMVDSPATSFGFAFRIDTDERGNKDRILIFNSPVFNKPHFNPKLVIEYTAPGLDKQATLALEMSGSAEMSVYPNPSNGIFTCNIKSTSTDYMKLRVIDMLGRTVYSQPVNTSSLQMRVNLPTSSTGTYFVVLQDNKGATIVSQQLQVN